MDARRKLAVIAGSFFYLGHFPFAPGTFGSLAAVLLFLSVRHNYILYSSLVVSLLLTGFLLGKKWEVIYGRKDPPQVIIDEVAGMLLSFIFVPYSRRIIIVGFFLFRLLDTLKPYPANRFERFKGGAGIMMDDIIAGLYTNCVLQAVARLASLSFS